MNEMISFVIPVYNEENNLLRLFEELNAVAAALSQPYEIIFIDDCSIDGSLALIRHLAASHPEVKFLSLARNSGQSAALYAGFQLATGEIVITLDADLQNDPHDIPEMLRHYGRYDMVTGWRHNRQDPLSKRVASRIGNAVRNALTGENIHDTGCSLKVMRATLLKRITMYQGLHRFLPTLMRLEGARVIEVKVNHRPRANGTSKYRNLHRGVEGLFDLLAVRWMIKRRLTIITKETYD